MRIWGSRSGSYKRVPTSGLLCYMLRSIATSVFCYFPILGAVWFNPRRWRLKQYFIYEISVNSSVLLHSYCSWRWNRYNLTKRQRISLFCFIRFGLNLRFWRRKQKIHPKVPTVLLLLLLVLSAEDGRSGSFRNAGGLAEKSTTKNCTWINYSHEMLYREGISYVRGCCIKRERRSAITKRARR